MKIRKTGVWLLLAGALLLQCNVRKELTPFYQKLLTRSWKVTNLYINNAEILATDYSRYRYIFSGSGSYSIITSMSVNSGCYDLDAGKAVIVLDKGTPGELVYLITRINDHMLEIETTLPADLKEPQRKLRIRMSA